MGYREVRIYDGPFPAPEQILTGDPGRPPFPKEVWLQEVQPAEFAVRYKDFKTGLPRSADGMHVQASEVCRVFGDLEEARADSRGIVDQHWMVVCVIHDHTGAEKFDLYCRKRGLNVGRLVHRAGAEDSGP